MHNNIFINHIKYMKIEMIAIKTKFMNSFIFWDDLEAIYELRICCRRPFHIREKHIYHVVLQMANLFSVVS